MRTTLRPALVDVLLALVLTGLTIATLLSLEEPGGSLVAFVLAALMAAPLALRQRAPVVTLTVVGAAIAAYSLLGYGDIPGAGVGLLIALFTVATLRPRAVVAVLWGATVGVLAIVYTGAEDDLAWPEYVQAGLIALGAWVLGESTRRWGMRTRHLAERAARAAADERVRLARELHDIASHHMSVISLQAGMAQYVVDTDPHTAREAMATVGDASRAALTEMRRLLDVLRLDHDEDPGLGPQPGLAMLDALVERTRGAGLPVELAVTGRVRPLPPGPDLCAYRVAQESLTNVLKHAGPARARIDLDYGERMVTLRVSDDGTTARHGETPAAHGIRGMRERAELYGGVLAAGPGEHGGFHVVLRLPVSEQ